MTKPKKPEPKPTPNERTPADKAAVASAYGVPLEPACVVCGWAVVNKTCLVCGTVAP